MYKKILLIITVFITIAVLLQITFYKRLNPDVIETNALIKLGYSKEDISTLRYNLLKEDIKNLLESKITKEEIIDYLNVPHFDYDSFEAYKLLEERYPNYSKHMIVNLHLHETLISDFTFTNIKPALLCDIDLCIVNKNYILEDNYIPSDLVDAHDVFLMRNVKLKENVFNEYKKLYDDALAAGFAFYVFSGYRSFDKQYEVYMKLNQNDTVSARPGHSEHQTGQAIDIGFKNIGLVENTKYHPGFIWLTENVHKYGFIIRYPEGKTDITGYSFEPWHLRYVGEDIATVIYENDITLEEYILDNFILN